MFIKLPLILFPLLSNKTPFDISFPSNVQYPTSPQDKPVLHDVVAVTGALAPIKAAFVIFGIIDINKASINIFIFLFIRYFIFYDCGADSPAGAGAGADSVTGAVGVLGATGVDSTTGVGAGVGFSVTGVVVGVSVV
jgi:hypothetical protein